MQSHNMESGVLGVTFTENFPACRKEQCVNQVLSELYITFFQARSMWKYFTSFTDIL